MDSLGIQPAAFLAQLVIIFIIYFLLKKFVFGPVTNMLDKRAKEISSSLKKAEEIEKKQQALEEKVNQEIKKTHQKSSKIITDAKKIAQKEADKIVAKAKARSKENRLRTLKEVQKEIKGQKAELDKQIAGQAAQLAQTALKKVLKKADKQLINQLQANKLKQWQQ